MLLKTKNISFCYIGVRTSREPAGLFVNDVIICRHKKHISCMDDIYIEIFNGSKYFLYSNVYVNLGELCVKEISPVYSKGKYITKKQLAKLLNEFKNKGENQPCLKIHET